MLKKLGLAAAFGSAFLITGCGSVPVSLSPASTYISPNDSVTEIGPASGSSFEFGFLGAGGSHEIDAALERALKSSGGDALVSVKVEYHSYFLLFGVVRRTEVYGTAVKIKRGGNRG